MTEKSRMDKAFDKNEIFMIMDPLDINKLLINNYRYYPATDVEFDGIGYFKFVMYEDTTTVKDLISAFNDSIKFGNGFGINIGVIINIEKDLYESHKELVDAFIEDHNIPSPYFIERRGKPQKKWNHKAITDDQVQDMIDVCDNERDIFMVTTLYHTGMRIGEFIAMRKHWIKVKDGIMAINIPREEGDFKTKSKAGERIIFIKDENVISLIREWFKNHESFGLKNVMAWKRCIAIGKKASIKQRVTPHILRHTCITKWMWDDKIEDSLVQKMAGHASIQITMNTYTHQIKGEIPESVKNW